MYAEARCVLGEGGCWHRKRNSFFWVDILKGELFEKCQGKELSKWSLHCFVSAIFDIEDEYDLVWLLTDKGLLLYSLQAASLVEKRPLKGISEGMRTNDAGIDREGSLVYGTMYCDPQRGSGGVYRLLPSGDCDCILDNVRIPNTILWDESGEHLYIADSYEATMYVCDYSYNDSVISNRSTLLAFDELYGAVPDGSAMTSNGTLWTACWGGSVVVHYDEYGKVIEEVRLPVSNPTSCVLTHDGKLIVTSASDGLRADQVNNEPLAGCVMAVQVGGNPIEMSYCGIR